VGLRQQRGHPPQNQAQRLDFVGGRVNAAGESPPPQKLSMDAQFREWWGWRQWESVNHCQNRAQMLDFAGGGNGASRRESSPEIQPRHLILQVVEMEAAGESPHPQIAPFRRWWWWRWQKGA